MYSDKENINILTSLLVGYGVKHIVVCPGSRNAPLAHNFDACPNIICHAVTDERSAAFVALGLRTRLQEPVAVCVTSGSALLNTLPGTAEATYQQEGIIVISADRPEAWIGQMDGQTLPQHGALGCFAEVSVTLPEPKDDTERWLCRRRICEAMMANMRPDHPSVHINVPVSEPLFSFTAARLPDTTPVRMLDMGNSGERNEMAEILCSSQRLMVVSGQTRNDKGAEALMRKIKNAVVIGEWLSPYATVRHIDEILRISSADAISAMRPDHIIYIGGNTVSKRLRRYMRSLGEGVRFTTVSEDGLLHDVSQHTSLAVKGTARDMMRMISETDARRGSAKGFAEQWAAADSEAERRIRMYEPPYSQMLAVRMLEERLAGTDDDICYANSMSVRLGMMYATGYRHCNRGLNGIEGSMSVAAGMASARKMTDNGRVYCIIGDLSFFYDNNALWTQKANDNMRILLLNNQRGAIFGMLPGLGDSGAHPALIAATHSATSEGICKQYGIEYHRASDTASLCEGIKALTADEGNSPVLLEVMTDAESDTKTYIGFT